MTLSSELVSSGVGKYVEASAATNRIRFGRFEVDLESGELFKNGRAIKLQGQPIQILVMLLEKPGRVVTREELQQRLWPKDTFVDFDHSLNAAIQRLREALNDSADTPRFIETLPRRGYRFICPTEQSGEVAQPRHVGLRLFHPLRQKAAESKTDSALRGAVDLGQEGRGTVPRAKWLGPRVAWIGLIAAILLGIGLTGWRFYSRRSVTPPFKVRKFTSFPGEEGNPAFSPDGNQVAFCWNGPKQDNEDIYVQLIDGGKPLRLTTDPAPDLAPAWSPDGRHIAFLRGAADGFEILIIPALRGAERTLGRTADIFSYRPKVSWYPDGRFVSFADTRSDKKTGCIYLVSVETGERQQLTSPPPGLSDSYPVFSPDGQNLAFIRGPAFIADIYVLAVFRGKARGEPRRLTFDDHQILGLDWMHDGSNLVFSSRRSGNQSLWKIAASGGDPIPLAGFGGDAACPSVAQQGNRLIYEHSDGGSKICRIRGPSPGGVITSNKETRLTPLIKSTLWETDPQFSPDGRKIAYSKDMEVWICDADGTNEIQLTNFEAPATGSPRWSPDQTRIAFDSIENGNSDIYVAAVAGGHPRRLTTERSNDVLPSWSKDGHWVYFGSDRSGDWQIWKIPSEGGTAVQVTRQGGWEAFESVDGQWLYYTRHNHQFRGVWRVSTAGGEECQVLGQGRAQSWSVAASGIYLFDFERREGAA